MAVATMYSASRPRVAIIGPNGLSQNLEMLGRVLR
jgi:hypothetical protein